MILNDILNGLQCSSSCYDPYILEWMEQATADIDRLQHEVESLTKALASRTEHLA